MWQSTKHQKSREREKKRSHTVSEKKQKVKKWELDVYQWVALSPSRTLCRWKPKPKPRWKSSFSSFDNTMGTSLYCGLESWIKMTTTCELVCGASLRIVSANIRERNTACCVVHFTNRPQDSALIRSHSLAGVEHGRYFLKLSRQTVDGPSYFSASAAAGWGCAEIHSNVLNFQTI